MIGRLDFSTGTAVLASLLAAVVFPAILALVSRLPGLRDRNALQFCVTGVLLLAAWGIALGAAGGPPPTGAEVATSLMLLGSALLVYLEIWGLFSRGYTLGLLLTLFHAKAPMSDAELAASYRRGEGLGWIMRHRLGGLFLAGLVHRQGDRIVLTSTGLLIARLYRAAIAILGLKVTG